MENLTTTLAGGTLVPALSKLTVNRETATQVALNLSEALHLGDALILTVTAFGLMAVARRLMDKDEVAVHLLEHVSQAAKLGLVVYAIDCLVVILRTLGVPRLEAVSPVIAKVVFVVWVALRCSAVKRFFLMRLVASKQLGIFQILDKLSDGAIFVMASMFLLDLLDVELGAGLSSVFAFGSAGTLMVGLASKDIASMLVSGMTLTTSNRVNEGDDVNFGDGTSGVLQKLGWMQSTIRRYDEYIEVIPNSILGNQRVQNVSRVSKCRVQQFLRFRYQDGPRLAELLPQILEEIKESCPEIITDGSRPYRAVWSSFREDHLEVLIDVHFHLPPSGVKYANNRMKVNEAIYRAVQKSHCEFVTSFSPQALKHD